MARIAVYYEQFDLDQNRLDSWHEVLKNSEMEDLEAALMAHVSTSVYPPRIADLLNKPAPMARFVPDAEQTAWITSAEETPACDEVRMSELAKMRKILGIDERRP